MVTLLTSLAVLFRIFSTPFANVLQKQLTAKGHHPLVVNFLTYLLLGSLCLVIVVQVDWRTLPGAFWLYAVLAGLVGALGNGFLVTALQLGDLSVLGPINSYKSVVGMIVGIFVLRELPNLWGLLGIGLIVYGSYFVLDTTEERFSWALLRRRDIRYRILAMVLTAIEAVLGKKIILMSSNTIAFLCWCWFGGLFAFLLVLFYRLDIKKEIRAIPPASRHAFVFLILSMGLMQITTIYAFRHIPVGYALSLFQLSTIISVLFGRRYFSERHIRKKLVGAGIMIMGSVMIILLKDL